MATNSEKENLSSLIASGYSELTEQSFSQIPVTHWCKHSSGTRQKKQGTRVCFDPWFHISSLQSVSESELESALSLQNISLGQKLGAGLGASTIDLTSILSRAFSQLYKAHRQILGEPHPKIVSQVAKELIEALNSKEVLYRIIVSLTNFEAASRVYELGENVLLRPLTEKEFSSFYSDSNYGHRTLPKNADFCLEFTLSAEVNPAGPAHEKECKRFQREIDRQLNRILRSLHCCCPGAFSADTMLIRSANLYIGEEYQWGWNAEIRPPKSRPNHEQDLAKFEKFYKSLGQCLDNARLLAVDRISDARLRKNPRDKFLDAATAIEALLLRNQRDGISDTFKNRYSLLFSGSSQSLKQAEALYNLRSRLAHGSPDDDVCQALEQFSDSHQQSEDEEISLEEAAELAVDMASRVLDLALNDANFPDSEMDWRQRER